MFALALTATVAAAILAYRPGETRLDNLAPRRCSERSTSKALWRPHRQRRAPSHRPRSPCKRPPGRQRRSQHRHPRPRQPQSSRQRPGTLLPIQSLDQVLPIRQPLPPAHTQRWPGQLSLYSRLPAATAASARRVLRELISRSPLRGPIVITGRARATRRRPTHPRAARRSPWRQPPSRSADTELTARGPAAVCSILPDWPPGAHQFTVPGAPGAGHTAIGSTGEATVPAATRVTAGTGIIARPAGSGPPLGITTGVMRADNAGTRACGPPPPTSG